MEIVYDDDYEGNYWVYKFRHPLERADRGSSWANWCNNINFPIIRYADVLLMPHSGRNLVCLGRVLTKQRFPLPGRE